jgi:hypothetical protein
MTADDKLHQFVAYQKSCLLFDLVMADLSPLARDPMCVRLVSASADPGSCSLGWNVLTPTRCGEAASIERVGVNSLHLSIRCLRCWISANCISLADSISSNIEESYGRRTRRDYAHFLVIARGSATETRGRYEQRLKHWLPQELIAARAQLCEEIVAILSASIRMLRAE